MKKRKISILIAGILTLLLALPMNTYAGTWLKEGEHWLYQKDDGTVAKSQWVLDQGIYYYLDSDGIMMADTTTPDGYLVRTDGSWVCDRQVLGGYVKTPYDKEAYTYRADMDAYIFNEYTDGLWGRGSIILAAVRGICPVTALDENEQAVYTKVLKFLTGFPYGASDYEKAKAVYEYLQSHAVYEQGDGRNTTYSVLVEGKGQCVGFAGAYKLLAKAVGLDCAELRGHGHRWNLVYIDGIPKNIDASTIGTSARFYLDRE